MFTQYKEVCRGTKKKLMSSFVVAITLKMLSE